MISICMKMDQSEDLDLKEFGQTNSFGVDDIYQYQQKRVTKNLDQIKDYMMRAGHKLFE